MCDTSRKMKDTSVKKNVKNETKDKQSVNKKESTLKSTNEDVQRAIEGLKEIPDEELQEFLDDEDFMEGLDVVDAWEGDEEKKEVEPKTSHNKEQEQRRPSRDKHRRDYKGKERPKREEKKHEETRRDPSKSTKDIERDKIRTKRDNESKLLAEKEKAIKHLLDSDDVVPPGTEVEAIQSIAEKQSLEQTHSRRSRERRRSLERQGGNSLRRRSPDRIRVNSLHSPRRKSPLLMSPERGRSPFKMNVERHRSPMRFSPDKRRSPRFNCVRRSPFAFSPDRRRSPVRRLSWERRTSADRRWSAERHRRRTNTHERRRSRSRDRQRSRSMERIRRKISRSPVRRYSPRRRSRSRSRSVERRTRKRSPFINELTRQLRNEAIVTTHINTGYAPPPTMDGIPQLMNTVPYQPEGESRPPLPMPPYMHQAGLPPPPPPMSSGVASGAPPFMSFENSSQLNFEPVPLHPLPQTEYVSGPVMYNQPNTSSIQPPHRPPLLPAPISSPQPEPTAGPMEHPPAAYNSSHGIPPARQSPIQNFDFPTKPREKISPSYRERSFRDSYNGYHASQEERLKTPEPPVISDTKQFEKTSLSSLLEASVSAKDSATLPVLYPGFKPEIMRHCEHALRELPIEDPRLKMKGRFFYDPEKENVQNEQEEYSSNSILLQRSKSKICWEEEESGQHLSPVKQNVQTHQKICQTDTVETDAKFVQATVTMVDVEVQVHPQDLQHKSKEEKRPVMDRLDWNMRETFDFTPKYREVDDLRWSLSNSSQKRSWSRTVSPPRRNDDRDHCGDSASSLEHSSRNLGSPIRNRDSFSSHKGSMRDHYVRERYSPNYRHSMNEHDDDFHDNRSDHSRGESPVMLEEDSEEELEMEHTFQRGSDWHGRGGKMTRGRSSPHMKPYTYRGKYSGGRPYRGRGGYRGKF